MGKFDFGNFAQSAADNAMKSAMGMLGSWIQNRQQKGLMKYQDDLQRGLMDKSNGIWQQQNAIQFENQRTLTRQNPILQKEGMIQAGLNPANSAMSGNVAAAPTGTNAPQGSVGLGSSTNPFAGFSDLMDIFTKSKEIELLDKNIEKTGEESGKTHEEMVRQQIENFYAHRNEQINIDAATADYYYKNALTNYTQNGMHVQDAQVAEAAAKTALMDFELDTAKKMQPHQVKKAMYDAGVSEETVNKLRIENEALPYLYAAQTFAANAAGKASLHQAAMYDEQGRYFHMSADTQAKLGEYYNAMSEYTGTQDDIAKLIKAKNELENQFYEDTMGSRIEIANREAIMPKFINSLVGSDNPAKRGAGYMIMFLDYMVHNLGGAAVNGVTSYMGARVGSSKAAGKPAKVNSIVPEGQTPEQDIIGTMPYVFSVGTSTTGTPSTPFN